TNLHAHLKSAGLKQDSGAASSVDMLASKMSLWVERIVVLADTIKTLEKTYNLAFQTLEERMGAYAEMHASGDSTPEPQEAAAPEAAATADEHEAAAMDDGVFEIQSSASSVFRHGREPEADFSDTGMPLDESLDIAEHPVVDLGSSRNAAGRPKGGEAPSEDFERERRIFFSAHREDGAPPADGPVEIPEHLADLRVESDEPRPHSIIAPSGRPEGAEQGDLGAVRFDSLAHPAEDAGRGGGMERHEGIPQGGGSQEPEEDGEEIFDLYALGAVDYAPHHAGSRP
ncbi:MAG: hypothetical protein HY770_02920, partial [Chitinivibrionia bacterium]|nr:hypothetical protein [Chitinivibrionia bacterium]